MGPRTVLAAVVVVAFVAVGGVQLLDPQFGDDAPPAVDFSAPPATVAADAATRLEYVDYAYRLDLAPDGDGQWEQFSSVRVDHTNRRYRAVGPLGERGTHIFGTDAVTFARPWPDEVWRVAYIPEATYSTAGFAQPFSVSAIHEASGSIVRENASTVVIRLDANPLRLVEGYPGRARLRIDKRTNVVVDATVAYEVGPERDRVLRFELVKLGTTVERLDDLPMSPREFFWDFVRGPLFRVGPE